VLRDVSHVRNYTAAEWVTALGAAGFTLEGFETHRLRLEFANWTTRTRTPEAMVAAIRRLQQGAPDSAKTRFAIEADGSFEIEVASFRAVAG
jgi:hypothetical protein